jgi:hypothetical protein
MRKVVDTETKGRIRVTTFDDDTARIDGLVSGKILGINRERPQENSNGKVFYIATVEVEGGQTGSAIIWENQLTTDKLPADTFADGASVRVAIQLKGDYAGNATIELPGGRFSADLMNELLGEVDLSAFASLKKEGKEIKLGA